jgi:hypothetical protein
MSGQNRALPRTGFRPVAMAGAANIMASLGEGWRAGRKKLPVGWKKSIIFSYRINPARSIWRPD